MQIVELKSKGQYTHPNPLTLPPGAMLVADNVVIDREDTTEERRGVKRYGTSLAGIINKLFNYKNRLLVHHGSTLSYDSDGAGTWVDYTGTYSPPAGASKIRGQGASKNYYFATSTGVYKIDSLTATPALAGMAKALDGTGASSGGSGFMANNVQVAYRVVWGKTDANTNKILGAPSQRIIVANTSGATSNVALTFSIPAVITTAHFYQIYRSVQTTLVTDEPLDDLQLVVEASPSAAQITAKAVVYTDVTPDGLRGAYLYTSPSQQTIAQSNEPPPLCRDIAFYKNMTLYANTISKHRLNVTMISVGGSSGLLVGDTVTIAGTVYTGAAAEVTSTGTFLVQLSGTAAQNIDATAKSLIRCINQYASNTLVYAFYLTGFADLPGQILLEERGIGGSAFVAISSRGGAFSPNLPAAGVTYTSANDTAKHRVYISKPQQPEAVPTLQYIELGDAQKNVLRIVALRDSVFVMKEDGVFRITGEDPTSVRQSLFDSTTGILNIESAVPFNNQVACFTTQGITAVSDSGAAIVSRPIELDLLTISTSTYPNFDAASFGCSYESDRKYLFGTVTKTTDVNATQFYVYNSVTTTFTRWYFTRPDMTTILAIGHAIICDNDNRLYVASADTTVPYVFQERKSYSNLDYADDDFTVQVTGQTGKILTLVDSSSVKVGYTITQGSTNKNSVVTAVGDATHITLADLYTWDFAPATAYKPIACSVKWAPIHVGNPSMLKHFVDLLLAFRNATFSKITLTVSSDTSGYDESTTLLPSYSAGWGLAGWGGGGWGGRDVFLQTIRTYTPLNKSRGRWLNVSISFSQALANFAVAGLSVYYQPMSQRSR